MEANNPKTSVERNLSAPTDWQPQYSRWRHGGWYVNNVRYPSGACGCISNNYPDKKWRIVCDDRRKELGAPGDLTFPSRDAAARAEFELANSLRPQAETTASAGPTFIVHFESVGFTDSRRVIDTELTEMEAKGFSDVASHEHQFPEGVVAVVGGYITEDDAQGKRNIKVFCRVKLRVFASDDEDAYNFEPPVDLLTRVADLMTTIRGRCLVSLEGNWQVADVESDDQST